MPVPVKTRVKASEARKRAAGLVRVVRWVHSDDLEDALAALEPFTARAALPRHRSRQRAVAIRFGDRPTGRLNLLFRDHGMTYDRNRDLWLFPADASKHLIDTLAGVPNTTLFHELPPPA